jgi:hypothetical protein
MSGSRSRVVGTPSVAEESASQRPRQATIRLVAQEYSRTLAQASAGTLQRMEDELSLEEIRRLSGDPLAHWVDPPKAALFVGVPNNTAPEELQAARMLFVGGLYLVESRDDVDSWYMGGESSDGIVRC